MRAIRAYLNREFGPLELRESEDFDRDGVIIRTARESAEKQLRIFISHEFLSDFDADSVSSLLRSWRIADKARALRRGFTLFVTTDGSFVEPTEGRTLREATSMFESIAPSNDARKGLYERVFAINVDGVPLGERPMEMQGDPNLYSVYSEEYASVLGAAYLLDAAGYRNFSFSHNDVPGDLDLRVSLETGETVYLDFKRALSAPERRTAALREQINVGLRRELRDDEELRQHLDGYFVSISVSQSPMNAKGVWAAVEEIARFVKTADWSGVGDTALFDFDAIEFPILSSLGSQVYVAKGPTYLSVQEGARTFSPHSPSREIARLIEKEKKRQFAVRPVWLGVSVADTPPIFGIDEILEKIPHELLRTDESPFERLIVGWVGMARVFPNADHN